MVFAPGVSPCLPGGIVDHAPYGPDQASCGPSSRSRHLFPRAGRTDQRRKADRGQGAVVLEFMEARGARTDPGRARRLNSPGLSSASPVPRVPPLPCLGPCHPDLRARFDSAIGGCRVVHGVLQGRQGAKRRRREPNRALSPAATAPAALTTPSTPHLNGGPVSADESTCRFKPAWKWSMRNTASRGWSAPRSQRVQ